FGGAARVGHESAGSLGAVPVEYLGDVAETCFLQVLIEVFKPLDSPGARGGGRCLCGLVHLHICRDKWSHQPGPNRTLVISSVAVPDASFVAPYVFRVDGGKASQTERRQ